MNVFDIGIDIIEIKRIKKTMKSSLDFKKIFTENEIEYFKSNGFRYESIAGNFAAKEAISKALGTGIKF